MAISKTEIVMQGMFWLRAWTIIATLDADDVFVLTPVAPTGMLAATPVALVLVPLTAAGILSAWTLTTPVPAVAGGWTLTKATGAGSGDAAPQLLVQMIAAPPVAVAHP